MNSRMLEKAKSTKRPKSAAEREQGIERALLAAQDTARKRARKHGTKLVFEVDGKVVEEEP